MPYILLAGSFSVEVHGVLYVCLSASVKYHYSKVKYKMSYILLAGSFSVEVHSVLYVCLSASVKYYLI